MTDLPLIMTPAGPVPTPPADIRAAYVAIIESTNPGYTANLPGSLIEDIASTDVGAIAQCDQARVDAVNSVSPFGANPFILIELGELYGVAQGQNSNTSVYVVFHSDPGQVIAVGFTVSDGTHQYTVQTGGIVATDGFSDPLFCLATVAGSWAVPPNTVTNIVTSAPPGVSVFTFTNPSAGLPGTGAQTEEEYRADVFTAGLATAQGTARLLKTALASVPGVQQRLVSVRPSDGGWEVIVGGGDPYQVANAIFDTIFYLSGLRGSVLGVTAITNANPAQVTTDLNHGFTAGQNDVHIASALGMTAINGGPYTVTVVDDKTFTLDGIDSSAFGVYTSGGVVTPNDRNITVSINDYPDVYVIPFVNPPQQAVAIVATWNTTSPNFVSSASVAQLASAPIVDYINSIFVGAPINILTLDGVFRTAIASILDPELLTRLVFEVRIDGNVVAPDAGTVIVEGDPESYFFTVASAIIVVQG